MRHRMITASNANLDESQRAKALGPAAWLRERWVPVPIVLIKSAGSLRSGSTAHCTCRGVPAGVQPTVSAPRLNRLFRHHGSTDCFGTTAQPTVSAPRRSLASVTPRQRFGDHDVGALPQRRSWCIYHDRRCGIWGYRRGGVSSGQKGQVPRSCAPTAAPAAATAASRALIASCAVRVRSPARRVSLYANDLRPAPT